jgi:hypothetical protein
MFVPNLLLEPKSLFALVLSRHPSANLMAIANVDGNVGHLFAKTKIPTVIATERLEDSSKVDVEVENPKECS